STFSERNYGAGTFRDFAQKLEKAGVLRVHQAKGGWLVAAAEGVNMSEGGPAEGEAAPAEGAREPRGPREAREPREPRGGQPHQQRPPQHQPQASAQGAPAESSEPVQVLGTPADGVSEMYRIISTAEVRKWPLYLRTVKQILRAQTPPFDERAYGFASLVDLLRASHKEGAFRVERDRQGVIRVFQSGSAGVPAEAPAEAATAPAAVSAHDAAPEAPVEQADLPGLAPEPVAAEAPAPEKKKRAARKPRAAVKTTKAPAKKAAKK
ncbi:MAG: OST-HTH/LOTUS domain-containing protein, partial [Acidobacteria bacterium]|nr:OST-HTH/LOTUS domain-containing protein [Acidobacteriota bacterium]